MIILSMVPEIWYPTDRQTDRKTDIWTDRQRDGKLEKGTYRGGCPT